MIFSATVKKITLLAALALLPISSAYAACDDVPSYKDLKDALTTARNQNNGGLNLNMWGTIVDRSGIVCSVAYTGEHVDDQWPGSRVISAQKANTANAFSLPGLALSTANLYSATQPGGSLFGLQESNPVNVAAAYAGNTATYGETNDPLRGQKIGGVNVFGGGLALYDARGKIVGALGVSGDTSCADHNIAWRTRSIMRYDFVPGGVAAGGTDQIIYDIADGKSAGGYGHPTCGGKEADVMQTLAPISIKKATSFSTITR